MRVATVHESAGLAVYECVCEAKPSDRPFAEVHSHHSFSFVRRGSFGYRTAGRTHELVAGSVMVGRPGREYTATHEHHECGDECLSVWLSPELAASLGAERTGDLARLPPLPGAMVQAELLQATVDGRSDVAIEEAALLFVATVLGACRDFPDRKLLDGAKDPRRAVEAAIRIDERCGEAMSLEDMAREAGVSPFHFLRLFTRALGVTPHQYLVRSRLRRAARLLAEGGRAVTAVAYDCGFGDLSNFVNSFRRAAGLSPGRFRRAARGERKIRQDRLSARAVA